MTNVEQGGAAGYEIPSAGLDRHPSLVITQIAPRCRTRLLIGGEQAWPMYSFRAKFTAKIDDQTSKYATSLDNAPERYRNSTGGLAPYPEVLLPLRADDECRTFADQLVERYPETIVESVEIELMYWETWCAGWFNHCTLPNGRDDDALIVSFEHYVKRHQWYQNEISSIGSSEDSELRRDRLGVDYLIVLMGAEDRYRWRGDKATPDTPVCRCAGCTKFNLVRINH